MAKETTTPLGYLMDMLYIQGTQLAKMVHVDRTVISRWRNGRSEFNMKSGYFNDVVDALIDINEQQGLQTLERFFSSVSRKTIQKRKDLQRQVATWLVSKDFDRQYKEHDSGNSLYTATYKIYKGLSGKRDALNYYWDRLNALPGGETTWGYDVSDKVYFTSVNDMKAMQNKMIRAQDNKNQMITLIFMNHPASQIYMMYQNWMRVYLSNNSHVYYTYRTTVPFYEYIYSVKGKLALVGTNHDNDKNNIYSAIYDDPMTLAQFDSFVEKMIGEAEPLIRQWDNRDVGVDFKEDYMTEIVLREKDQYIMLEEPSFLFFSKETMEAMVGQMDVNFSEERKLYDFYNTSNLQSKRFFGENSRTRLALNYDILEQLKQQEYTEIFFLSALLGHPVKVPSVFVLKELKNFIGMVSDNPAIDIALRPQNSEAMFPGLNLWIKDNSIVYFYPVENSSLRYSITEYVSVNAFYWQADEYWNNLPYECKQLSWIMKQLEV